MYNFRKMTFFKSLARGKEKYSNLLAELLITLIGTVLGIVLTFGVTYYSENKDKEAMARKAVMLTIHNLDVSISSMERLVNELSSQDSILNYVLERRTSVAKISPDTLDMFVSALYSHRIRPIDSSTEAIFSSNFEIWKYIDDPKVIGRIANCYSLMNKCGDEYERIEEEKYESFISVYDTVNPSIRVSDEKLIGKLVQQGNILTVIEALPVEIGLLQQLIENARALNDRNKSQLEVKQEELDEIGNLL